MKGEIPHAVVAETHTFPANMIDPCLWIV